jgi:predicted PurR-regulated permease PerM
MEKKYPFYFKSTVTLFGIVLFAYMLYMIKGIAVPLAFAFIISILLNPLVNNLQRKKTPKLLAIIIALTVAILVVAGTMYFNKSFMRYLNNYNSGCRIITP